MDVKLPPLENHSNMLPRQQTKTKKEEKFKMGDILDNRPTNAWGPPPDWDKALYIKNNKHIKKLIESGVVSEKLIIESRKNTGARGRPKP